MAQRAPFFERMGLLATISAAMVISFPLRCPSI
jgi:hypothetical protein